MRHGVIFPRRFMPRPYGEIARSIKFAGNIRWDRKAIADTRFACPLDQLAMRWCYSYEIAQLIPCEARTCSLCSEQNRIVAYDIVIYILIHPGLGIVAKCDVVFSNDMA